MTVPGSTEGGGGVCCERLHLVDLASSKQTGTRAGRGRLACKGFGSSQSRGCEGLLGRTWGWSADVMRAISPPAKAAGDPPLPPSVLDNL
ncbi:hypothetical protein KFL_009440040 [Klebsormidium nitens]|uniref:Uncharacterized protein n=1 Tax=Klebsormidium nitens TaxID=105231 RepID=A0A1Y1IQ80_KLENI|nr:hypothetical protein KFL_009440040 [Klebsormidium nitens]|eukprot:GAQ92202.1 hypothetical protein KFL_009440040 [Klebsormidium nitens]